MSLLISPELRNKNLPGVSISQQKGKYQFVLRYINQDIKEKYRVYENLSEINMVDYRYIKHTLTMGISWNF